MSFFAGLWTIASIELRQRVRGVAWYILLGVFVLLVAIVTAVSFVSFTYMGDPGGGVYSAVVYFVLLLASLTAPSLSGNSINGDRDNGTLATTQITLVSTTQLVLGKFLAAWISSLAFLVAAAPFLIVSFAAGGLQPGVVISSLIVLLVLLGVVSAVGVGLSGLIRRPLLSVVVTYLVVALLSVGTLIAFGLAGTAIRSTAVNESRSIDWSKYDEAPVEYDPVTGRPIGDFECTLYDRYEYEVPRFDLVWWLLAANPYVVLADAAPLHFENDQDYPNELFGLIKVGVRSLQLTPELEYEWNECDPVATDSPGPREIVETTTPSWFVGLAIHIALGAGLLIGAIAATRTPARQLAPGSRIA